jgi:hypothetical protein
MLSDTLALPITTTDEPMSNVELVSMFVRLVDVHHALEFDLFIEAPRAVAAGLASAMVGEPVEDDDTLFGVLGELVNIVGGGLKVCFEADAYALTLGLPKRHADDTPRYFCRKTVWLRTAEGVFGMGLAVHGRPVTKRATLSLREGMVLAEDVVSSGVMLYPSGFRLTSTSIIRLRTLSQDELSVVEL